ncbi:MAG TPA: hypothetical protein VMZ06_13310 [Candidatus Bathyarchaeia archaeon]|nr:hypothetical protein [Candidatus Bathyarchaeia archaeon]
MRIIIVVVGVALCARASGEAPSIETMVRVGDLGFPIRRVVDLANDQPEACRVENGTATLNLSVPLGEVKLFRVTP